MLPRRTRSPSPVFPDADRARIRDGGIVPAPEPIETRDPPAASLPFERKAETPLASLRDEYSGRFRLFPRDPIRLSPHSSDPAEAGLDAPLPLLESGGSAGALPALREEMRGLLEPVANHLTEEVLDDLARR